MAAMSRINLSQKNIALLGYGVENKALLKHLLALEKAGAPTKITILDRDDSVSLNLPAGVSAKTGKDYLKELNDFQIIFRTPGIPYLSREIQQAKQAGVIVSSQTNCFLEMCPSTVIGVTGTKGKGTTASLVKTMLDQAKGNGELAGNVYLAGNIGQPPMTILNDLTKEDWVILELSSFQLQDLKRSPGIAVVLDVGVDHLDHHRDAAEYISAKQNIVRYQTLGDFIVLNRDSLTSVLFAAESPAQAIFFSAKNAVDVGCFVQRRLGNEQIILRLPGREESVICAVKDVQLFGAYNLYNLTAALAASALAGASLKSLSAAARLFKGLPHRLQKVATVEGLDFYDDSKATTPESTIAAFLSFDQPVTLILGGSSKGADFTNLIEELRTSRVENVVCIGQEGERLQQLIGAAVLPQVVVPGGTTMTEIVQNAVSLTPQGGVVLLSPAAASFDMFDNAEDRGEQFQAAVATLKG